MKNDAFTMQELDEVIDAQKNNKTPGPGGCRAEVVTWLSNENRNSLLAALYNDVLQHTMYPHSFKKANLVTVHKKGDATQMHKYRPIALLQVFYKLLASLIRARFIAAYDPWIQKNYIWLETKEVYNTSYIHSKAILRKDRALTYQLYQYTERKHSTQ